MASTVPAVRTAPAGFAEFDAGGGSYRSRRVTVATGEDLVVFTDASSLNRSISDNRLLVFLLLAAFLVLALASTVFVSRASVSGASWRRRSAGSASPLATAARRWPWCVRRPRSKARSSSPSA